MRSGAAVQVIELTVLHPVRNAMISAGVYQHRYRGVPGKFADRSRAIGRLGDPDANANASEHAYLRDPSCVLSARAAGDARVTNAGLRRAAEAAARGSPVARGAGLGAGRGVPG